MLEKRTRRDTEYDGKENDDDDDEEKEKKKCYVIGRLGRQMCCLTHSIQCIHLCSFKFIFVFPSFVTSNAVTDAKIKMHQTNDG